MEDPDAPTLVTVAAAALLASGVRHQWFQWAAFTRDGKLASSYYDRQCGGDELTGWSDVSLAADRVAYPAWSDTRNPAPVLCPGIGTPGRPPRLCVTSAPNAPSNTDQEIYVAAVPVPSG